MPGKTPGYRGNLIRTTARGNDIDVSPVELLLGWISGQSLPDLANAHLSAAPKPAWRIAQMVGTVTAQFEHYLSWTIGALVELFNNRLMASDSDTRLCPELGGYIRYGVNTTHALLLMTSGIRSRGLVHAIVDNLPADLQPTREDLRAWLASMDISEWRERYDASAAEVLDLLEFTRPRNRSLLKTLLESGIVTISLPQVVELPSSPSRLSLEPARNEPVPEPLAVYADDQLVALIASQDHADVRAILDTGLDLDLDIDEVTVPPTLQISLTLGESEEPTA